jgi:hypothetical protein
MTDNTMLPPPGGAASSYTASTTPGLQPGRALLAAALVAAAGAVIGLVAGLIWAAAAPRVQYQVYTLHPPTAYATNPETSAFIAADGWYCFIALAGGALLGLLAYLFAVRRYGAIPMIGAVGGAVAAAYLSAWLGHRQSGATGFDHLLATSKPGTLLNAPISLGSQGALAFWPLAAAAVIGGIELVAVLRARNQPQPDAAVPMPGIDSFAARPLSAEPGQAAVDRQELSGQRLPAEADPIDGDRGLPSR